MTKLSALAIGIRTARTTGIALLTFLGSGGVASAADYDIPAIRSFLDARAERACDGRLQVQWLDDGASLQINGAGISPSTVDLATGEITAMSASRQELSADERTRQPRVLLDLFPNLIGKIYEEPSPDGSQLLTRVGDQAGIRKANRETGTAITTDGSSDVWYIGAGFGALPSWSPDGQRAALVRMDVQHIYGWPMVDWTAAVPTVDFYKLNGDRVGMPLAKMDVFIANATTGELQRADIPTSDQHFLEFEGWTSSGKEIYLSRMSRHLRRLELFVVDAQTGRARRILKESVDAGLINFDDKLGPILTVHPSQDDQFVWLSSRDGRAAAYLHDKSGRQLRRLTPDNITVTTANGIDGENDLFYFHGHEDGARQTDTHFYRTSLANGKVERLTQTTGQHNAQLAPDFSMFVDIHEDLDRPAQTALHHADGALVAALAKNSSAEDLKAGWTAPEAITVKAADGETDMYGVLFKPRNFDPKKSYPVIERIYGGMQTTAAPRSYMGWECPAGPIYKDYNNMLAYFTDRGYAVVVIDAPGTPGRTAEYQNRPWGMWPNGVIADHAAGVKNLAKEHPYLDLDRVGIDGNSWGGYMAVRALIDGDGLYKAAASSVPTAQNDGAYWEEAALGGTPKEKPEAWDNVDLINKADRVKGDLLIIGSTSDANAPISAVMKLVDALTVAGQHYELVIFPGANHDHGLANGENRYPYAIQRISEFFDRTLSEN